MCLEDSGRKRQGKLYYTLNVFITKDVSQIRVRYFTFSFSDSTEYLIQWLNNNERERFLRHILKANANHDLTICLHVLLETVYLTLSFLYSLKLHVKSESDWSSINYQDWYNVDEIILYLNEICNQNAYLGLSIIDTKHEY